MTENNVVVTAAGIPLPRQLHHSTVVTEKPCDECIHVAAQKEKFQ
jgi:hypothetical protein